MSTTHEPMYAYAAWLNSLSDADATKRRAALASVTYDPKRGAFRVYDGPREPMRTFETLDALKSFMMAPRGVLP